MLSHESDANLDLIRVSATPLPSSDSAEESGCETAAGVKEAQRKLRNSLRINCKFALLSERTKSLSVREGLAIDCRDVQAANKEKENLVS